MSTTNEKYREDLTAYLLEVATGNGYLKGTLLHTPDLDEAWQRYAPSFYGDAVREFNGYPEYCLACAGYLGMAVAHLWDKDWIRRYGRLHHRQYPQGREVQRRRHAFPIGRSLPFPDEIRRRSRHRRGLSLLPHQRGSDVQDRRRHLAGQTGLQVRESQPHIVFKQ